MPVDATKAVVLDREFSELRARLLQAAAQLDRLDRASGELSDDPRMQGIERAIAVLAGQAPNRAEAIQLIFSRPYDPDWKQQFQRDCSPK
jgi:hypothetical protein